MTGSTTETKAKPVKHSVHIDFTPEEYQALDERAKEVGLSVTAFVRSQSLTGKTKGYNMTPLLKHSTELGEVVREVRKMIGERNPDRWKYEADIERMETMLQELVESERTLCSTMSRRLKR